MIRPVSSTIALSVVRSPWTICARSDGQTGTTTVVESIERALDQVAMASVPDRLQQLARAGRVLDVPEHRATRRWVEEPPQRSTHPRHRLAPMGERIVGNVRGLDPATAGQYVVHPHVVDAVAGRERDAPVGRIRAVRSGTRHQPGDRHGQRWIDARDVQHRERFHVERGRVLGEVRHLHDGDRVRNPIRQQERLVALATEVLGIVRAHPECPLRELDDLGRIERRTGRREHGIELGRGGRVHGAAMVAARMAASSRTTSGPSAHALRSEPRSQHPT